MEELNLTDLNEITGGMHPLVGIAFGYVGSKVIDASVSIVKKEIESSKARSEASRKGKIRVKTSRGYRYR